ncbi:Vacuolar fusion protein mon1 [Dimargaris xerosporica]|nr:Vacuolar fusion protein mon1 [Dimargaris xerosporica]
MAAPPLASPPSPSHSTSSLSPTRARLGSDPRRRPSFTSPLAAKSEPTVVVSDQSPLPDVGQPPDTLAHAAPLAKQSDIRYEELSSLPYDASSTAFPLGGAGTQTPSPALAGLLDLDENYIPASASDSSDPDAPGAKSGSVRNKALQSLLANRPSLAASHSSSDLFVDKRLSMSDSDSTRLDGPLTDPIATAQDSPRLGHHPWLGLAANGPAASRCSHSAASSPGLPRSRSFSSALLHFQCPAGGASQPLAFNRPNHAPFSTPRVPGTTWNTPENAQSRMEDDDMTSERWLACPKHFFVLSNAGKPIYTRYGNESRMAPFMGVIQTLVAFFTDTDDAIQTMRSGHHQFVFLLRAPLYLVAVSQTDEPEVQLRYQLLYLYDQILSIVSYGQLRRIFDSHSNFDLRKMLAGTESMIDHLMDHLTTNFGFTLGSIESQRLPATLRRRVGTALKLAKSQNVLYAMLITKMKLISLVRLKKYSLYPSDLYILFSTVNSSTSFKSGEHWVPICLPKLNRDGFIHAYIHYISTNLTLVLLSPDRHRFPEMSNIKVNLVEKLTKNGDLEKLKAFLDDEAEYSAALTGVPGLRHFFYRSSKYVQHTGSLFADPYVKSQEKQSILEKYHHVWAHLHDKQQPARIYHQITENESMFGWQTTNFELYATYGPLVRKQTLVNSCNMLLKWIKGEEESLFVTHSPVF